MEGAALASELGGSTFSPGVYKTGSPLLLAASTTIYLDAQGDPNGVFIFLTDTSMTTGANTDMILQNGANADNVFWVLGTSLTMGAESRLVGNHLTGNRITVGLNSEIDGRAISQKKIKCEGACKIGDCTRGSTTSAPPAVVSSSPSESPALLSSPNPTKVLES